MAIIPTPNLAQTELDFDSLRARAFNIISGVFPDWTATEVANFGNLLVEMMCHVGDVCGFYIDNRARESRISTATQRQSVIALAKLLRYVPAGATAATADLHVTLAAVPTQNVIIPAGRVAKTLSPTDPVLFQTLTDLMIPAGQNPPIGSVLVEHSTSYVETFPTTGLPNQTIRLGKTPYLDGATVITAANGVYTLVPSFLSSKASDRHYTIAVDSTDRAIIRFGNGQSGVVPAGAIEIRYKTGGGPSGNVEQNSIRKLDGAFTDVLGGAVVLSVTNPDRASGGAPRESRAQIQQRAPESTRVLTRTVGREDYEINAKRVGGVGRALMLTSNQLAAIGENKGRLYIIPAGGGNPSTAMKAAVLDMVTVQYPNTLTFHVDVLNPAFMVVDVQVSVHPRAGQNPAALDARIRANLTAFFALTTGTGENLKDNPNVNFGYYASQDSLGAFDGTIAYSDVYDCVRDTAGVRKIGDGASDFTLNGIHGDLPVGIEQFPVLGTVTILNGETNAPLVG